MAIELPPEGTELFYLGRVRPEVQNLTLSYTIFDRKGTPFICLEIDYCISFLRLYETKTGERSQSEVHFKDASLLELNLLLLIL